MPSSLVVATNSFYLIEESIKRGAGSYKLAYPPGSSPLYSSP